MLPSISHVVRPISKEPIEHPIEMPVRDSRSLIRHVDLAAFVAGYQADVDDGIRRRKASRIGEDVLEGLNQAIRGRAHVTAVPFDREADLGAIAVCQSQSVDDFGQERLHVDSLHRLLLELCIDSCEFPHP